MQAKDPLSGRPGHLDPGQEHQLKTFRAKIQEAGIFSPERHDDACRECGRAGRTRGRLVSGADVRICAPTRPLVQSAASFELANGTSRRL